MKKRIVSLLLTALLFVTLLPAEALAYVGNVDKGTSSAFRDRAEPVTIKREGVDSESQIYSMKMKNGKLVFFLAVDGPHIGKSVTNSDRGYTATGDSFRKGVYEQARFTLQTGRTQQELTIQSMEVVDLTDEVQRGQLSGISEGMAPTENALTVKYTFSNAPSSEFACYISYYFVELDKGTSEGDFEATYVTADGHTYALVAQASWGLGMVVESTTPPEFTFRWFQEYHGFSRMGHAQADPSAHVKASRSYTRNWETAAYTAKSTDITAGMGRTNVSGSFGSGDICEVYSDSYGVDSPFVLAHTDTVGTVNEMRTAAYMTYDAENDLLTAECDTVKMGGRGNLSQTTAIQVWGFRDVYTKQEASSLADVKFTEPDRVTIPQDADRLGLYKSGSGIVAAPITDTARENVLKKKYGDPLYILCGDFEPGRDDSGKYYEYTDRKVGLTSTITATWGSGQHFRVRVDENGLVTKFDTTAQVTYSTPRFLLYSANNGVTKAAELTFDDDTLALNMTPEDNAVLVFIDIPEVSSRINKALIKGDGCLELSGNMGLDLILNCGNNKLATLEALGYGPKTEADGSISFVQNGIRANGELDTGSLMGLELGSLKADIDTFEGQEKYNFSLELNVFDLFETAATLNLKRLNNGRLAPNDLYFRLAVAGGIPIVPPVPTSFIKGGGGGFYGLADTINGDFIAIPPIRVKMSVKGDYVKVIEGWANVTVGPSYLEFAGTDLTIAKMDFIDEFKMYLRLVGEKREYGDTTYTGLRAGGGMGLTLAAPNDDSEIGTIFQLDTEVEASIFGGLDSYSKPTSAYVNLDSRGSLSASVKIPKKLGSLSFGKLGGKKLVNTQVDFILGAETAVDVESKGDAKKTLEGAITSAWDNLNVYGGISKQGSLILTGYRIYYIIPNHFGGAIDLRWRNDDWTLEQEIEKTGWGWGPSSHSAQAMSAPVWTTQVADCLDAETGEQVGIAVLEVSTYVVAQDGIALLAAPTLINGKTVKNSYYTPVTGAPDGKLGMFIAPADGSSVETLKQDLGVYNVTDDTKLTLVEAKEDADGNIPNSELENANMTEVTADGKTGLLINLGKNSNAGSTWRIEAGCDFSAEFLVSANLTGVDLTLDTQNGKTTATATITNKPKPENSKKTYAVRFYLDTEQDRTGTNYYLGMVEGSSPYTMNVPTSGALAPTGNYYVTAVLVEKVVADLNGNNKIDENEFSLVTVDTATSTSTIHYTNDNTPADPTNVTLAATGNETLTASWSAVDDAEGYRVALYYMDGNTEKQAGAAYVLENEDFSSSKQPHATKDASGKLSLRMAPTVGGNNVTVEYPNRTATAEGEVNKEDVSFSFTGEENDITPTEKDYFVKVEAFKTEKAAGVTGDLRYYSNPAESSQVNLPRYTAPDIGVTIEGRETIVLNGDNGYATLPWNALPSGTLFQINGSVDIVTVTPEQGSGTFDVAGGSAEWTVTASDEAAKQLIANSGRVKLTVKKQVENTDYYDTTDYYLRLALDDVPPLLTLDADNVCADMTTGAYTVAGRTEPGLTVTMENPNGSDLTIKADETGRFSFTGHLDGNATEGFTAILANVSAEDEAGNETIAPALISARPDLTPPEEDNPTDPSNPGGSSGGGSYGGGTRPSIAAEKTSPDARSATDYTDGIYGLTFRSSASFASFRGVQVDGKTIDPSNYIAEEGSIVVYLKAVYLRTLKPGKHTVTILSSEGDATMNFTIGGVTTGDAGIMLYAVSAALSLAGTAVLRSKKRRG